MEKDTLIFECKATVSPLDFPAVYLSGVWQFQEIDLENYYRDFGTDYRSIHYPGYLDFVQAVVTLTVKVHYEPSESSSSGTIAYATFQNIAQAADGSAPIVMVPECEISRTRPSGTVYDAVTDRCSLPSGSKFVFIGRETPSRLPLTINGYVFSDVAQRLGYSISYEDRVGSSPITTLNGDEYPDILARKPIITWPLNMLTEDTLVLLHKAIGNGNTYVPVRYYDSAEGKSKLGYFRGSVGPQVPGMINARGLAFQSGTVLTLRAR